MGKFSFLVKLSEENTRIDTLIASRMPEISRSYAALLVRNGEIIVNGNRHKQGYRVKAGDTVQGRIPPPEAVELAAVALPLDVIFEDNALIVVNKPAGMVVHPAAGHESDTLVNALLHHCPDLTGIGGKLRPGIVHRLDKDTSGVLVVAKNDLAHGALSRQFKERRVTKTYTALVRGSVRSDSGRIELPLGRHPKNRKKMSTTTYKGRPAVTLWRVKEHFRDTTLLEIDLKTGRTHQIRVHCTAMGHPIIGDRVYGRMKAVKQTARSHPQFYKAISTVKRQMLHAARLGFFHPIKGDFMIFEADLPQDIADLLIKLRDLSNTPGNL